MAYEDEGFEEDVIEDNADDLLDNDEVSAEEEGFLKGYDNEDADKDSDSEDDDSLDDDSEEDDDFANEEETEY